MSDPSPRPVVLTIAGSDSRAGAGVQADLKTIEALGARAVCAITAVTAQTAERVLRVHAIPPGTIADQIAAALWSGIDAIKLGLVTEPEAVDAIAEAIGSFDGPLVIDPVDLATTGDRLAAEEVLGRLGERLLSRASLITPNAAELVRLGGEAALLERGAAAVLVTGGDQRGAKAADRLVTSEGTQRFVTARRLVPGSHGSGCVLSSAIATLLAHGRSLEVAVREAKRFVTAALDHAVAERSGGSVDPLFATRKR